MLIFSHYSEKATEDFQRSLNFETVFNHIYDKLAI